MRLSGSGGGASGAARHSHRASEGADPPSRRSRRPRLRNRIQPGSKPDAPPSKPDWRRCRKGCRNWRPELERLLNASPYLREIWAKAQANGWKIQFVTEGRSHAEPGPPPRININLKNVQSEGGPERAAAIAALITHEMGHAATRYPELLLRPGDGQEFEKNTAEALKHEGEATLANLKAREEILKATGIDIGVRGGLDDFYKGVYEHETAPPKDRRRKIRNMETPDAEDGK